MYYQQWGAKNLVVLDGLHQMERTKGRVWLRSLWIRFGNGSGKWESLLDGGDLKGVFDAAYNEKHIWRWNGYEKGYIKTSRMVTIGRDMKHSRIARMWHLACIVTLS